MLYTQYPEIAPLVGNCNRAIGKSRDCDRDCSSDRAVSVAIPSAINRSDFLTAIAQRLAGH